MTMTTRRVLLVYAALGVALWSFPLLNILHVESAAIVAFAAFFVAGWAALDAFNAPSSAAVRQVLWRQEVALIVPLGLLTVSLLWAPNCDYLRGLLFYGFFPGVTVVFAVAVAYAVSGTGWHYQKTMLAGIGVGIALLGPLYDLGFHPQFYTYNHVFGGVLGPIYDEELAVRTGIFTFRGLTLLWAAALFLAGRWLRTRRDWEGKQAATPAGGGGTKTGEADNASAMRSMLGFPTSDFTLHPFVGLLGILVLIGFCYFFAAPLGLNTPAWYLQQQLGGHLRTAHFDLYYEPSSLTAHELGVLANEHEYRYAWLMDRLNLEDGPSRIVSYLYPDPDTKARLTGARTTSVAPVWLPHPQTHVLLDRYEATFGHELAHAFSRQFGLPVLNASRAVGLVEGLAVALEPPSGRPTAREQVSAALFGGAQVTPEDVAGRVASRLQPLGFWTGRGAVSYTTMGAFVQFLLDRYGPERLRAVYARANFQAVYGQTLEALTQEWADYLRGPTLIARDAEALVTRRFAQPSLFERACPHFVPSYRRAYREGRSALVAGDTSRARMRFQRAIQEQPHFVSAHQALAQVRLSHGEAEAVVQQLDALSEPWRSPALTLSLADAHALQHRPAAARARYDSVLAALPHYAHESAAIVALRRAVADRPDVLRVLVSADSAHVQAARLTALPDLSPAGHAWTALRHMAAGEYDQAATLWASLPPDFTVDVPPFYRAVLRRQTWVWQAQTALRRGAHATAQRYAQMAAEAFRAVGAFNQAAVADDLVHKATWMQARERAAP